MNRLLFPALLGVLLVAACRTAVPTEDDALTSGDAAADASDSSAPDVAVDVPPDVPPDVLLPVCPVGQGCDDGDPCTIDDACAPAGCKGTAKNCDDGSPCTIDVCQLDGACSHKPNMHWDCIPDLVVETPPRAQHTTLPTLPETGHVIPPPTQKSAPAKLTVQGKDVALDANLAFATSLALVWGPQTVTTALTDQWGGTRIRTQGVTMSTAWLAPGLAVAAGRVDGAPVLDLPGTLTATTPYTHQPHEIVWQFTTKPDATGLTLAAQPTPVTAFEFPTLATEVPAPTDLGLPLHAACTAVTWDDTPTSTPRWQLSADVLNAALRATRLAGALEDDISPLIANLYPPLTFTGFTHARAPWQLNACQPGLWTLTLLDLQVDIVGHLGDALFPGQMFLSITAHAELSVTDGVLALRLGKPLLVTADVVTLPPEFQATDGAVAIAQAGVEKLAPTIATGWSDVPLLSLPVPGMTQVTLGAGVVRVQ